MSSFVVLFLSSDEPAASPDIIKMCYYKKMRKKNVTLKIEKKNVFFIIKATIECVKKTKSLKIDFNWGNF